MPNARRMVQAVKARADPQAFAHAAKPQTQIGMLQAFTELCEGNNGHELPGSNTNRLGQDYQQAVTQKIVQQVIAVVAPHGHLALRVVQRMQAPPPFKAVLTAVQPVVKKVQHHQIHQ